MLLVGVNVAFKTSGVVDCPVGVAPVFPTSVSPVVKPMCEIAVPETEPTKLVYAPDESH